MDEKTEKINVIADEDVAVAEESGPVEERRPRRRAACAGGAAALAAVAVACALMMQPAGAAEVEGVMARAIIPPIEIKAPEAASAEALPETGGEEAAAEAADAPEAQAPGEPAGNAQASQAPSPGSAQGASSGSQGGSSGGAAASAPSQPQQQAPAASQPSAPAHQHSWQPVTEQRWVVDKAAWDEPKYEQKGSCICNGCGKDITADPSGHMKAAGRGSACSSWHSEYKSVQVGTIHHDAVGHNESVTVGYKCSCGATK